MAITNPDPISATTPITDTDTVIYKKIYLTPLTKAHAGVGNFGTWDTETFDGLKGCHLATIACAFSLDEIMVWENKTGTENIMADFLDYLITINKNLTLYAHVLSFDIRFVVQALMDEKNRHKYRFIEIETIISGSRVLACILYVNDIQIKFIDSFQFTLSKQSDLEKLILKKQVKADVNFEEIAELYKAQNYADILQIYRKRCKSDVIGLYQVLHEVFRFTYETTGIDTTKYISLASKTMDVFRKNYLRKKVYNPYYCRKYEKVGNKWTEGEIVELNTDITALLRSAYFGGRTEVFNKSIQENIWSFDVHSLYPSVFACDYPVGVPVKVQCENADQLDLFMAKKEGFLAGNIFEKYRSNFPLLPERKAIDTKGRELRTVFDAPCLKSGCWGFPVIRKGLALNLIEISYPITAILFPRSDFYGSFGTDLYAKRLKFKKLGDPRQLPCKIDMNALYGKTGQKPYQEAIKLCHFEDFLQTGGLMDCSNETGFYYQTIPRISFKPFQLIQIACYTTEYARNILYDALDAVDKAVNYNRQQTASYCDTDSLYIPEMDAFINNDFPFPVHDSELGSFGIEHGIMSYEDSRLKFFQAVAPKIYWWQDQDGKLCMKAKGVPKSYLQRFLAGISDYTQLVGELKNTVFRTEEEFISLKSSIKRKGKALSAETKRRQLYLSADKRHFLPDGDSIPLSCKKYFTEKKSLPVDLTAENWFNWNKE